MNRFFHIILLSALLLPFRGIGQPVTPAEDLDYNIEEFTLPGGRLGNNVNAIVQGPYGFMWFGAHGGLHRYDGYEFVTYKTDPADTVGETTSLSFQYIENLFWDHQNKLWVTTYGGGLFRFDPETEIFKHYVHDPEDSTSLSHPRVLSVTEDAQGHMWFGTENGLNRFDPESETFIRYYADPEDPNSLMFPDIRILYVDPQGTLWAGSGFGYIDVNQGTLSRYNSDNDSFKNYLVTDSKDKDSIVGSPVRGILQDSRGNFWIGTVRGLYRMDPIQETFELMEFDPEEPYAPGVLDREFPMVFSIYEDGKGGLWIGTILEYNYKSHLLRYDPYSKTSQVFSIKTAAWQVYESTDGTIWVAGAGDTGKVLRLRSKVETFDLSIGKSTIENYIHSYFNEKGIDIFGPFDQGLDPDDGSLWGEFGIAGIAGDPDSNVVALINYQHETDKVQIHPLYDLAMPDGPTTRFNTKGIIVEDGGKIWGSLPVEDLGIYRYDPILKETVLFQHDPQDSTSLSSNQIITLLQDSRGDIWASTPDDGLNRIDPKTGKITRYNFGQGEWDTNNRPIALMEDLDGNIWAAGSLVLRDGTFAIVVIDPLSDEIKKIKTPADINAFNSIIMMAQSPINGKVIFALRNNGIGVYDPLSGNFDFFNTGNGTLPFESASGVIADAMGQFWVFDNNFGTFLLINDRMEFYQFEEASSAGTIWRSGMLGIDGNLYFLKNFYAPNEGSWIQLDPAKITPKTSSDSARIRLVGLSIMGEKQKIGASEVLKKPLWMSSKISLPNSAQSFTFRYSDFDFQKTKGQFQFRLIPFENDWTSSRNSPIANYYKIPPGDYTLQVRSSTSGLAENRISELNVVILPPWWQTWLAYTIYGLIFIGGVFGIDRVQRRRLLQKAHTEAREKELAQAREIEKAYEELKTTQAQLIQSEKMASLGELTAGIAHEIQNPLNFVNNFSEINNDLADELREEIKKGNLKEIDSIAKNIAENETKIKHHGQRAENIVKGMLQHSRSSTGQKESTDINALADEYLRLAYHGLRAKDKSFNADFKTDFDATLPLVNVIPQDIGRVLLNLINNAFFAVNERGKAPEALEGQRGTEYKPLVTITTKKLSDKIEITVKDNGPGIPEKVRDKIFQPFFTTKPTGQGTGLGLSMSYDIVTKGHGGKLKVESEESKGTEFLIILPI